MPVTVTDWKRCLYVFLNGKTGKLHFTSISELRECSPPPRMKLFGNQQLECLQGHMFFPGRNTYISQTLQVTIKKVVYHIIFIVLATFQGIWRFWVYECTCLRISLFFCAFCRSGYFYSLSPFDNLDKSEFPVQNCDFGHIPEVDRLLGKEDTPSH